ncbi:MAG: trypsin-like peptidase domain-containing protein [Planctomycetaceae bacterium]|nr:trypsin-like peptidase domain-containing protein [Planctomycetaceae bacterium]
MSDPDFDADAPRGYARSDEYEASFARRAPAPPHPPRRLPLLVGLLFLLLVLWGLPSLVQRVQYASTLGRERAEVEVAREALNTNLRDTTEAFRLAAQRVGPSVVHIDADQSLGTAARIVGEDLIIEGSGRKMTGQGSGVIIDEAGYIITNYHVVANVDPGGISVGLSDRRVVRAAELIGYDVATDLAVLKIEADNLIAAQWGSSDQLQVGDWVLAVGNPYALDRSVTAGIISAKGRRGVVDGSIYQDFLQTDAAVNPGNSGGPLVDLRGEVVGINTAILGQAYQGISFAIPSRIAQEVYQALREKGHVARGWLGVAPQDISPEIAAEFQLPEQRGALITRIVEGSPADQADLRVGDVVLTWDGQEVQDATGLTVTVAGTKIGSVVPVRVWREGSELTLEVKVGRRPERLGR